jgi:protocatechuate 3,4-dioxygenase beta subunit
MKRKNFLKKGIIGFGSIITGGAIAAAVGKQKESEAASGDDCIVSPRETKGPFATKTPAQLIQSSIKGDRKGIAMLMSLTILDKSNDCKPFSGAVVDVWHCDKDGNYSEYGNHFMQQKDFTGEHFLRGRQTADASGQVSFLSIYPGWYHGRAPHIHLEIFNAEGKSLLATQVAFPENISSEVYKSSMYADRGRADTSNNSDNIFAGSLHEQMAVVTGNTTDGFTLTKTIVVKS